MLHLKKVYLPVEVLSCSIAASLSKLFFATFLFADQVGALPDSDLMSVLEQDDLHKEENATVFAIQLHLLTRLSNQDQQQRVRDLLRCVFPWSGGGARPSTGGHEHDPVLVDAIQSQFVADKLQATPQHVNKVCRILPHLEITCVLHHG